jgi:aminopeptidase N
MEYSGVASVGSLHYSMLTKAMSKIPWKKDSADKIHLRKAVRTWFECTLTHEIAHQWWAIGVGNDSQRHPFVDEALTNWSMAYYFEDRYGPARGREIRDSFLETAFVAALGTEDCKDAPANLPTSGYRDIHQYGMVAYCKGGLFYQKLRELTGDEVFFEALRDYYRQFRGKLADPADLRNIIIAHAPAHRTAIDALYRRWIEGAHGSEDISEPASP